MGLVELLIMLIIGAAAGWLAGNIMRGAGFGLIGNIIVGVIGSFVGAFLGNVVAGGGIAIPGPAWLTTLVWATIGAVVLLFIIGLFKKAV